MTFKFLIKKVMSRIFFLGWSMLAVVGTVKVSAEEEPSFYGMTAPELKRTVMGARAELRMNHPTTSPTCRNYPDDGYPAELIKCTG